MREINLPEPGKITWFIDWQGRDIDVKAFPERAVWSILERVSVVRDNVGAVVDNDDPVKRVLVRPVSYASEYYDALRHTLNELTSILDDVKKE